MSQFADQVEIKIKAGNGGNGKVSFRREKYVAKGGPDGGDGGSGGDVVVSVDPEANTLAYFLSHKEIKADDGENGGSVKRTGKSGTDEIFFVPPGTVVQDAQNGEVLFEGLDREDSKVIARGGKGGAGNAHFKGSTRQAPRFAELGEPGEAKELRLELKIVADVGIIGLPNAGKSTLLSVISAKKPEIADYPFTTIVPNLGMVRVGADSFVAADIPGLIEGASEGKGLGHDFLKHIERTKVLIHLIDGMSTDYEKDYVTVMNELKKYSPALAKKPQIVVVNKSDVLTERPKNLPGNAVFISAATGEGVKEILYATLKLLQSVPEPKPKKAPVKVITTADLPGHFEVKHKKNFWLVSGSSVETLAQMTDFDNAEGFRRFYKILEKKGVIRTLNSNGAKSGARVRIAGKSFHLL